MKKEKSVILFTRFALAASYLSAVADRFGIWGKSGDAGVVWGNMENFIQYTGSLLSFLPEKLILFCGWSATIAEIALAVLLLVGFRLKETGIVSAALLATFALTMTIAYGIKAPLDYSVLSACAASLLIAFIGHENETSAHKS